MARKVTLGRALELLSSLRQSRSSMGEPLVLRVHVDATCPRPLALAVRDALVSERANGRVDVFGLALPEDAPAPDAALVLVGSGPCADLARAYAMCGVPVALVAEGALDLPAVDVAEGASWLVGTVLASSPEAVPHALASWLAGAVEKDLALAACFPFCRREVCDAAVTRCAAENAAIGAISLIPGSDLPLMTLNQLKLALEVACANGRDLDATCAAALLGVAGSALVWRAAAHGVSSALPGLSALVKAGVGYGATVLVGEALQLAMGERRTPDAVAADVACAPAAGVEAPARPGSGVGPHVPALLGAPEPEDGYLTIGVNE